MHKVGLLFPGQGAQYVGMGRDLYEMHAEVRDTFAEAQEVLGVDVARLCFEGPQEVLNTPVNTQIAVLTLDIAVYRLWEKLIGIEALAMAGHSLGEYGALCAAGALNFSDTLMLVYARGKYQQEVLDSQGGCMAAVIGLNREMLQQICSEISTHDHGIIDPAGYNAPDQIVVSGHRKAVEEAMDRAWKAGARLVMKLPISAPCHCRLLDEAADKLKNILSRHTIEACSIPVIPNVDPHRFHLPATSDHLLARQINSPVRWQETVETMIDMGIDTVIELGPKQILSNLVKRIDKTIRTLSIGDLASFQKTMSFFRISSPLSPKNTGGFLSDKEAYPS